MLTDDENVYKKARR